MASTPRYPWTPEQEQTIRDGNAAGRSLTSIAAELGVTKRNLSTHSARLGLTWDRSRTHVATAAKVADAKGRRAALQLNLLEDAERLREQLWRPSLAYNFGGKDNTYAEHQLPEPAFADKLKIMQAVGIAVDRSLKLDVHDSGAGAGVVIGLLQQTAAALGIRDDLTDDAATS
jgi:hypothetical protein